MQTRMNPIAAVPKGYAAMVGMERYLNDCGLEHSLLELVRMRSSQINGCAYCLNMHSRDARKAGETEQRLYLLDAWREASCYSDRERAALAWTEAVTRITDGHVPDAVYADARQAFSDEELANLTLMVTQINSWNRLAIAFRAAHD